MIYAYVWFVIKKYIIVYIGVNCYIYDLPNIAGVASLFRIYGKYTVALLESMGSIWGSKY